MNTEFDQPKPAMDELFNLLMNRSEAIPDNLRANLEEAVRKPSPVVGMVDAVEAGYAIEETIGPELSEWLAKAAMVGASWGFHGLGENERGLKIAQNFRGLNIEGENPSPDPRFKSKTEEQQEDEPV